MGYIEQGELSEEGALEEEVPEPTKDPKKPKAVAKAAKEDKEDEEEDYLDLERTMVVKELPMQPIRKHKDEKSGVVTNFVTTEEALSDMTNNFKKLTGGL